MVFLPLVLYFLPPNVVRILAILVKKPAVSYEKMTHPVLEENWYNVQRANGYWAKLKLAISKSASCKVISLLH